MTNHICPYCLEPFEGRANRVFCSRSHAEMYHRKQGREPRKVEPNMTGLCLQCGAPVRLRQKYCCDICGKRWRYEHKYRSPYYEKQSREKKAHVCHYTDGVCIQCVNEARRAAFKANKKHIWGARLACVHHASFAHGD